MALDVVNIGCHNCSERIGKPMVELQVLALEQAGGLDNSLQAKDATSVTMPVSKVAAEKVLESL